MEEGGENTDGSRGVAVAADVDTVVGEQADAGCRAGGGGRHGRAAGAGRGECGAGRQAGEALSAALQALASC